MAEKKSDNKLEAAAEALKESGARVAQNSAALSTAVIDHAEANTREAFAALRAAARATDLAGGMKVQGDYIRDQGARSMAQAREVGELIAKFGRDAVAPLTGRKD